MIMDQKLRNSDDLFIDHCSLVIERRVVPLCRRGEPVVNPHNRIPIRL